MCCSIRFYRGGWAEKLVRNLWGFGAKEMDLVGDLCIAERIKSLHFSFPFNPKLTDITPHPTTVGLLNQRWNKKIMKSTA